MQVILDHVARAPKQVSDSAEHGTVAQSPDVHEIQEQLFPIKALPTRRHAALGTISTRVFTATMLAHMGSRVTHIDRRPVVLLPVLDMQDPSAELAVPRVLLDAFALLDSVILRLIKQFHIAKVQKILQENASSRIFLGCSNAAGYSETFNSGSYQNILSG